MPEMINTEVPFKPVVRQPQLTGIDTSIVDEDIQVIKTFAKLPGCFVYRSLTCQIEWDVVYLRIVAELTDTLTNRSTSGNTPAGNDHFHPTAGQFQGSSPPDPLRTSGDENDLILHIEWLGVL